MPPLATCAPPTDESEATPLQGAGLGGRAAGAAKWRFASMILQAGLQFGVSIVLARLLAPDDFGLATLASVLVGLATLLLDLGLGAAVVQSRPLTERHVRVSFTLALLVGSALSLLVYIAAPLAAPLLHADRLTALLRAEAPLFLFSGIGVTARALLQRKLLFRSILIVDVLSYALGYALFAVTMAILGFGVWSLIVGALVQSLLSNSIVLSMVRHPIRPLLARAEAVQLLRFGAGGSLNGAVNHVAFHGDNLIAGRLLGVHELGLYARSFSLMMLPLGYAGNTIFSVMFPALSELKGQKERFARAYLMSVTFTSLAMTPILVGMAVAAPHLMVGLYGPQWARAAAPLQIFCLTGLFRVLPLPAGAVTHASGQVYAELRRQVLYALWVLAGAAVGSRWGVAGVACGVATAILFKYVAMGSLSLQISGSTWRNYLAAQLPGIVVAAFVGAVALGVRFGLEARGLGSLAILGAIIVACAPAALVATYLLPPALRPIAVFDRVRESAARLPSALRVPLCWALHYQA